MAKKSTFKYNRIRVVLADQEKSVNWLAGKLKKDRSTVSKYINNEYQPSISTLFQIADFLDVDVTELLEKNERGKSKKL